MLVHKICGFHLVATSCTRLHVCWGISFAFHVVHPLLQHCLKWPPIFQQAAVSLLITASSSPVCTASWRVCPKQHRSLRTSAAKTILLAFLCTTAASLFVFASLWQLSSACPQRAYLYGVQAFPGSEEHCSPSSSQQWWSDLWLSGKTVLLNSSKCQL